MPGEIVIGPVEPADLEAIHRIEKAAFPAPWRREFFESELRSEWRFNRVARRGNAVVGYVFSMYLFEEMHVNKLAVVERERRQGIAVALMETCFAFARKNGISRISLEVRQSNAGAQEFYEHLQFRSTHLRPRYYPDGEAAVVMTREV